MSDLVALLVFALSISSGPDPTATQCAEVLSQLTKGLARVTHVRQVTLAAPRAVVESDLLADPVRGAGLAYTIQSLGDDVAIVVCAVAGSPPAQK